MKTDYDYYLLGCQYNEVVPLSLWRFTIAHAKYQQMLKWEMNEWKSLSPTRRVRTVTRFNRLRHLAALIKQGKDLIFEAARMDISPDGGTDAGNAGAGDREPRVPLTPVLAGGAGRSLPRRDEYFVPLRM